MGFVYADIELINGNDIFLAKKHLIGEEEIKRIKVSALVDSGSYHLVINENIQEYLQLSVVDRRRAELANGEWLICDIVGPVEIRFKNRFEQLTAMVVPGSTDVLLGAIPMEALDVLIHPKRQELIVNPAHPDGAVHRISHMRVYRL